LPSSSDRRIIREHPEWAESEIHMTERVTYEVKEREATRATVRVTVDPAAVRDEVESVYRRYSREIHVPGFRRGKVPKAYLESRFGRDAFADEAREELQRRHLPEALARLSLQPVSTPEVSVVSSAEDRGFAFEASFDVLPDVAAPEHRGIRVRVPPVRPVTEEDVEAALEEIRGQFATLREKLGDTVGDGDFVRVRGNDREWDTRAEKEDPVTGGLVGARVGEAVEIDAEVASGQRIRTRLWVVGLRRLVLPEIDDELAKDAGSESLDDLRADIRRQLTEGREERYRSRVHAALLGALVNEEEIPLPAGFLHDLVEDELAEMKGSLERAEPSLSFDQYLEQRETNEAELRGELRRSIEQRLRRELVLRTLAEENGISIDDAELETLAAADAAARGEEPLHFVARLKAEDRWDAYRTSKVNERVFALLRESAVIEDAPDSEEVSK